MRSAYEQAASACSDSWDRYLAAREAAEKRALAKTSTGIWSAGALSRQWQLPAENLDFPHAFRLIPTINFCVSLIQRRVAALPLEFFLGRDPETRRKIKRSALNIVDLWESANSEQTGVELLNDLVGSLMLQGNAFLNLDGLGTDRIQELWILDPLAVKVIPIPGTRKTDFYAVRVGMEWKRVERDQIIHFRLYDPGHGMLGASPLTALQLAYETHRDSGRMIRLFYGKGGTLAGHYSTEMALDEDDRKLLKDEIEAQTRGPEGAWKPVLLPRSLKYQRAGLTMDEMQFIETHRLTKEEILLVYMIPPMMAGIADGSGLNSDVARVAERMLHENAIAPLCTNVICPTLDEKFLPKFGRDLTCEFDFSGVLALQRVWLEQAEAYTTATGAPIMTRAEARQRLGLPESDDPEADVLLVPLGMMPSGEDSQGTRTDEEAPPTTERVRANHPDHLIRDQRERLRVRAGRSLRPHVRRMRRGFRRIFNRQERVAIERLEKQLDPTRAIDVNELLEDEDVDRNLIRRLIRAIVAERGQEAINELGLDLAFDLTRREIRRWIEERAANAITHVNDTTRQRLRDSLAEGVDAGEGLDQLTARVHEVFDGRRDNALTIARTETIAPYNFSTVEGWKQSGVVEGKEWLSARDEAVRDAHQQLDGVVVPLNGFFEFEGHRAEYPGGFGVPELDIQCRCTLIATLIPTGQTESIPQAILDRLKTPAGGRSGLPSGAAPRRPRATPPATINGHSLDLSAVAAFLEGDR